MLKFLRSHIMFLCLPKCLCQFFFQTIFPDSILLSKLCNWFNIKFALRTLMTSCFIVNTDTYLFSVPTELWQRFVYTSYWVDKKNKQKNCNNVCGVLREAIKVTSSEVPEFITAITVDYQGCLRSTHINFGLVPWMKRCIFGDLYDRLLCHT